MSERLAGDGESAEPEADLWDTVLEHDDDTDLPITISDMDGSNVRIGTINVGTVRRTLEDPGYQEMMRNARERAQERRTEGQQES
jgi:hypothetical protein